MDLNDILMPPASLERPEHPDMMRLIEISAQLRAEVNEVTSQEEAGENWHQRIEGIIDFDSLAYQAINLAMGVLGITTAADWMRMRSDRDLTERYIMLVQCYYDGFIMGALFEQRGGHQEVEGG